MQTNAEALQRSSRVTRLITGGLPVPLYAVAFLLRNIDSGCQNTALDLSLSSLPEVTDSNSDLHLKNWNHFFPLAFPEFDELPFELDDAEPPVSVSPAASRNQSSLELPVSWSSSSSSMIS